MKRHSIRPVLPGLFLALLLGACASTPAAPTAQTEYEHGYDFSRVHKIAIQPIDRTVVSTIQISDAQIRRINDALTSELQRRGFQVVANNAEADMFLTWKLATEGQMNVNKLNTQSQYNCLNCAAGDSAQEPEYIEGTLVVEMIDPIQLQSVWRASIESRLLNESDPQLSAQRRQEAAEAILAQFPPNTTPR